MSFPLPRKQGQIQIANESVQSIAKQYGTPLYIYDETTLRERCKQIKQVANLPNFKVYYSAKANTNIALLQIIRSEGLFVDAMSLGELRQEELAGFTKEKILFVSNNLPQSTLEVIKEKQIAICVDSLSQLQTYVSLAPTTPVYIRLNIGQAQGHHDKVKTTGKVKFGIALDQIDDAFSIAKKYKQKITGFMLHSGSLFLDDTIYLENIDFLLQIAKKYADITYIDFGGGIGIPYDRTDEKPFPLESFSEKLTAKLETWMKETGRRPTFAIEPGRFIVAESGVSLMRVHTVKENYGVHFIGTDLGFNTLLRPEFYDAYHEIIHTETDALIWQEPVQIVGNICESGDYLGKNRLLPKIKENDLLLIRDTGAYGFSMASNYNSLLRPAEIIVTAQGKVKTIRKRETIDQLLHNQIY